MKRKLSLVLALLMLLSLLAGCGGEAPASAVTGGQAEKTQSAEAAATEAAEEAAAADEDPAYTAALAETDPDKLLEAAREYNSQGSEDEANYEKARALFEKAAAGDKGVAMYFLGTLYRLGRGVEQDADMAEQWYRQAAERLAAEAADGDSEAMYYMGLLCSNGYGLDKDLEQAERWLKQSSDAGNDSATLALAGLYYSSLDRQEEAFALYQQAAEAGNDSAAYTLGELYFARDDMDQAENWYRKAIELGNARGYNRMGSVCARRGDFAGQLEWVQKYVEAVGEEGYVSLGNAYGNVGDGEKMMEWYQKAADLGYSDAYGNIGMAYVYGLGGIPQDGEKAVEYLEKGYENGWQYGAFALGELYRQGEIVRKDLNKAVAWYEKIADTDPGAQAALESLAAERQAYDEAMAELAELEKTAESGDSAAVTELARFYLTGNDVLPADTAKAKALYDSLAKAEEAAPAYADFREAEKLYFEQQDYQGAFRAVKDLEDEATPEMLAFLGDCCYYGKGTAENNPEAYRLYSLAESRGSAMGAYGLGMCSYFGYGTGADQTKGGQLLKRAVTEMEARAESYSDPYVRGRMYEAIGHCYYFGLGVEQSYDKALEAYRLGADCGHPEAAAGAGSVLYQYKGETAEALRYYTMAAEKRSEVGAVMAGQLYLHGDEISGIDQDLELAVKYLEIAVELGNNQVRGELNTARQQLAAAEG